MNGCTDITHSRIEVGKIYTLFRISESFAITVYTEFRVKEIYTGRPAVTIRPRGRKVGLLKPLGEYDLLFEGENLPIKTDAKRPGSTGFHGDAHLNLYAETPELLKKWIEEKNLNPSFSRRDRVHYVSAEGEYTDLYPELGEEVTSVSVPEGAEVIDGGEEVACDSCNFGEDTLGGCIVGGSAYCGDCTKDMTPGPDVEMLNPQQTFRANVLEYRRRVNGHRRALIMVGPMKGEQAA